MKEKKERKLGWFRGRVSRVSVVHLAFFALLLLRLFPPLAHSVHICHSILLIYFPLPFPEHLVFFLFLSFFYHCYHSSIYHACWDFSEQSELPCPPCRLFIMCVIHHVLLLVRNYFVCAQIKKSRRLSVARVNYRSVLCLARSFLQSNRTDLCPQPSLFLLDVMFWRLGGNPGYVFLLLGYEPWIENNLDLSWIRVHKYRNLWDTNDKTGNFRDSSCWMLHCRTQASSLKSTF